MHTYLLQEATWEASGTYADESGHQSSCWGRTTISHGDTWTIEGFLTVQADEVETFRNRYHVTPLRGDAASTEYSSESPDLGTVQGRFTFVGDTILTVGRAQKGEMLVVEALREVNEDRYESRGKLLSDGRLLSSWAVSLRRER